MHGKPFTALFDVCDNYKQLKVLNALLFIKKDFKCSWFYERVKDYEERLWHIDYKRPREKKATEDIFKSDLTK